MVDEPERRREIDAGPEGRLRATCRSRRWRAPTKAALNLLGLLPSRHAAPAVCRARRAGDCDVIRAMLERHGLLQAAGRERTLRVLPLGGLGEIGKNMTVVEYDGRIVVVDTGLRFPTTDMLGIDLVLPDFTYLRERADDIEAIVVTHGHEDHLGALPWVLRELGATAPPVYGGRLTVAMARSKLDEHKLRDARARGPASRRAAGARPVQARARAHDALDPRLVRGGAHDRARHDRSSPATTSSTRPRSTACRPTSRGSRSSVAKACCCCAATRPTPTVRASRRPSATSDRISRRCSRGPRDGSS